MPPATPDPASKDAPETWRRRAARRPGMLPRLLTLLAASGLLAACGQDEGPITDVRERSATRPRAPETSTKQRFQDDPHGGRLLRLGTPRELLTDPGDDFVAALMSTPQRQAEQLEALAAARGGGGPP